MAAHSLGSVKVFVVAQLQVVVVSLGFRKQDFGVGGHNLDDLRSNKGNELDSYEYVEMHDLGEK